MCKTQVLAGGTRWKIMYLGVLFRYKKPPDALGGGEGRRGEHDGRIGPGKPSTKASWVKPRSSITAEAQQAHLYAC